MRLACLSGKEARAAGASPYIRKSRPAQEACIPLYFQHLSWRLENSYHDTACVYAEGCFLPVSIVEAGRDIVRNIKRQIASVIWIMIFKIDDSHSDSFFQCFSVYKICIERRRAGNDRAGICHEARQR